MRILVTTDVVGGVWSYSAELVDALARRGHALALVAFGGCRDRAQREWTAGRPWLDFTCVPCPLEWMPEPEPGLSESVDALRRQAVRFQPDVIHLNQFFYGAHELGAPTLVVAHSDVVTWWRVVHGEEPPDDAWFRRYRGWVNDGLEGADMRVAPTACLAGRIREAYGTGPVRAVHNARSPELFAGGVSGAGAAADGAGPAAGGVGAAAGGAGAAASGAGAAADGVGPAARRAGAAADVSPGERGERRFRRRPDRVVSAGRLWDEAKGARDLISAGRKLGTGAEIVIAGAVRHPGGGEDFPADAAGIEYAGRLHPADLAALYGSASVYAATSRYEPFGLAPLEAALAGCALVMSDIPTFRELWADCARFYPAGDAGALADALRSVLSDDGLRSGLAAAAHERALDRYSPERMAGEYEALYSDAARSASSVHSVSSVAR